MVWEILRANEKGWQWDSGWQHVLRSRSVFSTQEEMDKCFELLNEQSEYIEFTQEKPEENWLPFLHVQVRLSSSGYMTKHKEGDREKHVSNSHLRVYGEGIKGGIEQHGSKIPFTLPVISDEVSIAIMRCLRRADLKESVAIVETPPDTLRRQLVCNGLCDRLCETQNCVVCPYGRTVTA
uniref:RNase H domain-containing protein n=1 Tax=Angiostrongylus cantonensis TaxID=6313 RepID=A0A0K0D9J2_ANGCA